MELKRPLPANRTLEQLEHHYLVEKEIATRLKAATREQRKRIYATMYDELFLKVPDHPRLSRRADDRATERSNRSKFRLVRGLLDESTVFLEYAPGDCRFVTDVAMHVRFAYGLDISDQRRKGEVHPENFKFVVYDGYTLDEIPNESIDVIFSDQLIEHFHPEDTKLHFELAYRLLKPNGQYAFRTPHPLTGPHDVSQYFSDVPECFHLKEWRYGELDELIRDIGFSRFRMYWSRAGISMRLPRAYFAMAEGVLTLVPRRLGRMAARSLVPQVYAVAVKGE